MVSTRSHKKYGIDAILELSKITAAEDEARRIAPPAPTSKKSSQLHKTKPEGSSSASKRSPRRTTAYAQDKAGQHALPARTTRQTTRVQKAKAVVSAPTAKRGPIQEIGFVNKTRQGGKSSVLSVQNAGVRKTRSQSQRTKTTSIELKKVKNAHKGQKPELVEYTWTSVDTTRSVRVVLKIGDSKVVLTPTFSSKRKYTGKFFSNKEKWRVGYHPFLFWKGVERPVYYEVFCALQKFYAEAEGEQESIRLSHTKEPLLPGHAYTGQGHMFKAFVEPIISAATNNNNQKLASDNLTRKLTYRNGKVSNVSPNYHKLMDMTKEELASIMRQSGRQKKNAEYILALYKAIRAENITKMGLGEEEAAKIHQEALDAGDWTDGLLSLDFMVGLTMQEMFDKLVSYLGIGAKTAACIMCFSFGFAVFAVDTHVFRLCQWLRWVPFGCTPNDAFKFLTVVVPPELMRDLHQAFWHHGQLCYRCNEKTYKNTHDRRWKECICTLEEFGINRFPGWEQPKSKNDKDSLTRKGRVAKEPKDPNSMITVSLKTDKDVADARAAGFEIRSTAIDDAWGMKPEMSNIKKKLKQFLHITHAESVEFKKFQKAAAVQKAGTSTKTKVTRKKRITTITEDVEVTTTTRKRKIIAEDKEYAEEDA